MRILWIWNSNEGEPAQPGNKDVDSFRKHDEYMKKFSITHPKVEKIEANDVRTTDALTLAPLHRVKLAGYSQN